MRTCLFDMRHRLVCLVLTFILAFSSGCSSYVRPHYSPDEYPYIYRAYDLTLYWKTVPQPGSLTIAGFVKNSWPAAKLEMELTATLLAADRRELGQGSFLFFPHSIDIDATVPFNITIPLKLADQPHGLLFLYHYVVRDNDDTATTFHQQVEVDLKPR
ncbi:MAG TPA: hypothetical protein VIU41_06655 [Geobacteraceae bacterium]